MNSLFPKCDSVNVKLDHSKGTLTITGYSKIQDDEYMKVPFTKKDLEQLVMLFNTYLSEPQSEQLLN